MSQYSVYQKRVMHELIERSWTTSDLAKKVSEKTGLFCDTGYLSKIFSGKRKATNIVQAINEILGIESE